MGRELPSNLTRRGTRIWVRKEVPKDVRLAYGKAEVFESTGHADDKLGRAAGLARVAELEAEWAEIRAGKPRRPMIPADRRRAALDLYDRELAVDERRRLDLPTAEQLTALRVKAFDAPTQLLRDIEAAPDAAPLRIMSQTLDLIVARGAADHDRDRRHRLIHELRKHLGSGETVLVSDMAAEVIRREGGGRQRHVRLRLALRGLNGPRLWRLPSHPASRDLCAGGDLFEDLAGEDVAGMRRLTIS